jgi:hypothetical protein
MFKMKIGSLKVEIGGEKSEARKLKHISWNLEFEVWNFDV